MTLNDATLDCIVVGYNDVSFQDIVKSYEAIQKYSGAYHSIRTSSIPFGGERVTYMDLLNRSIERSSGQNPRLHVAKMPSLGAWHLRSFLAQHGYRAEVVNAFNFEQELFLELLAMNPRCVAITTTFYLDAKPVREVVDFVRMHSPATRIVVGGPHVFNVCEFYDAEDGGLSFVLDEMGADIYVHDSQGELALSRVVAHLRGDSYANETTVAVSDRTRKSNSLGSVPAAGRVRTEVLAEIPNLVFMAGGRLVRTPRVLESNDMDVFVTNWSGVSPEHYSPTAPTRTARSCAFSCAFCRYPILAGPLNLTSIERMEAQFDEFQRQGVKQLIIIDDTFNVPLPRFKDLLRMMIRNRYDFEWFSYFRASNSDDECFDLMARSNCGGVFLGIESGDQTILNHMNKSARVDKYVRAIGELNRRGIITFACLIAGFPGETDETIRNTVDFIRESKPQYFRAELYYHGVNAPIHARALEFGLQGAAFSWSHRTMNWQSAAEHIARMYQEIDESIVLPVYMYDFWCIPYLLGQGINKQQILEFNRTAGSWLRDDLADRPIDGQTYMNRLSAIFS